MNRYYLNGEQFLQDCLFDGLAHSYDVISRQYVKPYPEVTGYVIKYLCEFCGGQNFENVKEASKKLCAIQEKNGGYKTFYDKRYLYSFDTAQILNGLLEVYKKIGGNDLLLKIHNAGNFLLNMQRKDGAICPAYDSYLKIRRMPKKMYSLWNGATSGLLSKTNEAYKAMYDFTNDIRYEIALKKSTRFYISVKPLLYTHPLGYWLEGLFAGGEIEFVEKFLKNNVINRIEENGFISYVPDLDYSYTSGQAQLAILLFKCNFTEEALIIRNFLRKVQMNHKSGGLFQYVTRNAEIDTSIHSEINSWGTKYFCELERMTEVYE